MRAVHDAVVPILNARENKEFKPYSNEWSGIYDTVAKALDKKGAAIKHKVGSLEKVIQQMLSSEAKLRAKGAKRSLHGVWADDIPRRIAALQLTLTYTTADPADQRRILSELKRAQSRVCVARSDSIADRSHP